jgi:hypothetical protein
VRGERQCERAIQQSLGGGERLLVMILEFMKILQMSWCRDNRK